MADHATNARLSELEKLVADLRIRFDSLDEDVGNMSGTLTSHDRELDYFSEVIVKNDLGDETDDQEEDGCECPSCRCKLDQPEYIETPWGLYFKS